MNDSPEFSTPRPAPVAASVEHHNVADLPVIPKSDLKDRFHPDVTAGNFRVVFKKACDAVTEDGLSYRNASKLVCHLPPVSPLSHRPNWHKSNLVLIYYVSLQ